jgi:peroxiredoxin
LPKFYILAAVVLGVNTIPQPSTSPADELRIDDAAPDFILPYATKDTIDFTGVRLSDIVGKDIIILAFYPADWSGGCTKEVCTFRDNFSALSELGAVIYGISGDYVFSHKEWAKHHDLPFTLLSDHSHEVARAYNSFNDLTGYNRRTVFVIDREGKIAYKDLSYNAGSTESFEQLKLALRSIE